MTGVYVVPMRHPFHLAKAETVTGDQIRQILHFLKQHYDYIIVDTSKSFSPPTLATFEQADQVYLITNVDLPSLRNITRCLPLLERMGAVKGDEWLRLVVNRYQASDPITLKEIEKTLGLGVYWTLGNDFESVMNSINAGRPVVLADKSTFARDLKSLVTNITGIEPDQGNGDGLMGGIRRMFGSKGSKRSQTT